MKLNRWDYPYLHPPIWRPNREAVLETTLAIRKKICAYTGPPCDCKYGATEETACQGSERGNGCPELATAASVLARLTDEEYDEILARKLLYVLDS